MSSLIGRTLGSYIIVGELGHGGMATVYLARQPSVEREVAIKVLPAHFLQDRTFLERFTREARVVASLQHPHILPIYDFGEHEGQPYIAMACMRGGTLTDRIAQAGRGLPLDEAVRLVEQIASGLDYAHKQGIVHRDFKPGNVLMDHEGNVYLADFGIAKVAEATAQLTGSGIIGTPAYMAPEMAERGGVSHLVDIYALGVTLYQMLTGELPYDADTPMGLLMAHISKPIPDVRILRPDLPEAIQAIIERAMAKNPAHRYQTALALATDLRTVLRTGVLQRWTTAPLPPDTIPIGQETSADVPPTGGRLSGGRPGTTMGVERGTTAPERITQPRVDQVRARRKRGGLAIWLQVSIIALVICGLVAGLLALRRIGLYPLLGISADTPGPVAAVTDTAAKPEQPGGAPSPEQALVPTDTPAPTNTLNYTPTATGTRPPTSTASHTPTLTSTPTTPCPYDSAFVADVTVPDGTEIQTGDSFTKTWRVKNNGCQPWSNGTSLIFVEGNQMSGPNSVAVPATAVNGTQDISVTLYAPGSPGDYAGYWQLRSAEGITFGDKFSVRIKAVAPPPEPAPSGKTCSAPLKLYYSGSREDNFTTATADGERAALDWAYWFIRIEGYVYSSQVSGTVPLKLYYSVDREDNFTTATADGERAALDWGYNFIRIEGYVYSSPVSGTVPLKLFYSVDREDNF
jgi:tRNA A-37 threonylcarbamoyl transferase component Bud32